MEAAGAAEGQNVLPTLLAASCVQDRDRWHICQCLRLEEERGTWVVEVTVHGAEEVQVQVQALPELHCEPSVTEEEAEEHLADFQSYCPYSAG